MKLGKGSALFEGEHEADDVELEKVPF